MKNRTHLAVALLVLAACSSRSGDVGRLTLNDPSWERVNVQVVFTKSSDCDSRGDGFIAAKDLVMRKNKTESLEVPTGTLHACWRHDRNPNSPAANDWTGWTRATLFPGQSLETEI